jgi:hypothetical protein
MADAANDDLHQERIARWGQERRLEFIDFRLAWEGRINRADLTNFFAISTPQASLDISRYIELAPGNLEYNRSDKVYVATSSFKPVLAAEGSSQYLNQVLAVSSGMMSRGMSFLGWYPSFDAVLSPGRSTRADVLFRILQAIRYRRAIAVEYQSLSRPEPSSREISPHAIAYDGFRWHARAYCHSRKEFRDFVFARMLSLGEERTSDISPQNDESWNTTLTLLLGPHPNLPLAQKRAIELDYGMKDGKREVPCRKALLFYMLRRLNLDRGGSVHAIERRKDAKPQAQQIVLLNREELQIHLKALD